MEGEELFIWVDAEEEHQVEALEEVVVLEEGHLRARVHVSHALVLAHVLEAVVLVARKNYFIQKI